MAQKPKIVFLDTEFTGEHAGTSLVSVGLVTLEGDELYCCLNDYDKDQVTPWLQENVLSLIAPKSTISSFEAYELVSGFLSKYSDGERLYVVSCGLLQDFLLLTELYRFACPERKYFHSLYCLPDYLNHHAGIDLNTLLRTADIDPGINKLNFLGGLSLDLKRHRAIDDAKIVRSVFLKIMDNPSVSNLVKTLIPD